MVFTQVTSSTSSFNQDEALFKISSINAVMGGEISYPGITDNEKPCFKCSLNTRYADLMQ